MRVSKPCRRVGGTIGMALVLSTAAVIGFRARLRSRGICQITGSRRGEHQEQREIAKLKADISRLDHDLAAIPPEVNSMRMYAGSGSGPMLAAAQAWDAPATELQATASSYESVTAGLATEWWSGSATSATAAAAPYVSWLNAAAQQAENSAALARAEAAPFEQREKGLSTQGGPPLMPPAAASPVPSSH